MMKLDIGPNVDTDKRPRQAINPLLRRLTVAVLLIALIQGLAVLGIFHRLDLKSYDYFLRFRGAENPGQEVMIVALDDATAKKLGPFPLSRGMHARLLSKLKMASAVAFNMTFGTSSDAEQDALFAAAIKSHGKVILPCVCAFSEGKDKKIDEKINLPVMSLLSSTNNVGFLNIPTDEDALVRRATLVDANYSPGTPIPSLAFAAVLTNLQDPLWKVEEHTLDLAGYKIYMDASNRTLFNYWGPAGTIPTVSYADVLKGRVYPECFAGKIVIVGYTDTRARDAFLTPFTTPGSAATTGGKMPGVEIQASIMQSLLNGGIYREMPASFQAGFLALIVIIGVLVTTRRTPLQRMTITAIYAVVVLAVIYGLWRNGLVFYPAAPLLGALGAGLISQ